MTDSTEVHDLELRDYYRRIKQQGKDRDAEVQASLRPREVVTEGRQVPLEGLSGRLGIVRIAKMLEEHGWDVRVGESEYFSGDVFYESSKRVKAGKKEKHRWLQAVRGSDTLASSDRGWVLNRKLVTEKDLKIHIETGGED